MKFKHLNFLEWIRVSVNVFRDGRSERLRGFSNKNRLGERRSYKDVDGDGSFEMQPSGFQRFWQA